jgi:hypothetical protein
MSDVGIGRLAHNIVDFASSHADHVRKCELEVKGYNLECARVVERE